MLLKFSKFPDQISKNLQTIEIWKFSLRKECGSCRSCQEPYNVYVVAKIVLDTVDNAPFQVWYRKLGVQVTKKVRQVTKKIRRNIGGDGGLWRALLAAAAAEAGEEAHCELSSDRRQRRGPRRGRARNDPKTSPNDFLQSSAFFSSVWIFVG